MRLAMVAAGQYWTQMYYRFDSRLTGFVLGQLRRHFGRTVLLATPSAG
jgi:hypothetical protein